MKVWRCDLVPQYENYKEEIDSAIKDVLATGRYVLSTSGKKFEEDFSKYLKVKYAIGVANATDGLILSLKTIGIEKGDEVITTPFTAIPTVSAIIAAGATPVFVDVDPETFLIDIKKVQEAITVKTKVIMPVHIFGNVVDIKALREIVGDKIFIIEDAAQAHGSKIDGLYAGTLGDMGVFSFYPTKNLGGYGDGGAVVTNSEKLAKKLKLIRNYGMVDKDSIVSSGVNSRLDEIQAAILSVKLKYLDQMNDKRESLINRYREILSTDKFIFQKITKGIYSCNHVFVSRYLGDRKKLMSFLEEEGIQSNIYYIKPLYKQEALKHLFPKGFCLPNTEKLCSEVIAFPFYPELSDEIFSYIKSTLERYFS